MKIRKSPLLALLYILFATGWAFSVNLADLTNTAASHPLYPYFLVGNQILASLFWVMVWGAGFICALILVFNTKLLDRGQPDRKQKIIEKPVNG
jgi:hypothetical protein